MTFTGPQVKVISFGYGHAPAPEADLTIDVRRHLRNPHHDLAMRHRTGLDAAVRRHVLDTPGARSLIRHAATAARDLAVIIAPSTVTIAVGCVGGRHRSVAMACAIVTDLCAHGVTAEIIHRDVERPVIQRRQ